MRIYSQKVKRGKKTLSFTSFYYQYAATKQPENLLYEKTMMLAQQLYENVEIEGEGSVGLITYMRTDSIRVSKGRLHRHVNI